MISPTGVKNKAHIFMKKKKKIPVTLYNINPYH